MKPQILLIPDRTLWIIGEIASQIKKLNSDFEFITISRLFIEKHQAKYLKLINEVDLVHLLTPYQCKKLLRIVQCPKIVTLYHCTPGNIDAIIGINDNQKIIVISSEWKEYLVRFGCDSDKIEIIHLGINTNFFVPYCHTEKQCLRKKAGIDSSKFVIGFFGKETDEKRKGTDILICALQILKDTAHIENYCIVLTGIIDNDFKQKLSETGVCVINLGYLKNKKALLEAYQLLDCYLIASRVEGGPYPLLEAISCQVPVITTPVGLAKDIIQNYHNGILILKDHPHDISAALIELKTNDSLCKKISIEARKNIIENFSWEKTISKLSPIYDELVEQSPKRLISKYEIRWIERETIFLDRKQWIDELKRLNNPRTEIKWSLNLLCKWPHKYDAWLTFFNILIKSLLRQYF